MDNLYATVPFAGIWLDTIITPDKKSWVTLSSLAKGIGVPVEMATDWVRLQPPVNSPVEGAYPVASSVDFLDHLLSLGNPQAIAIMSATFQADLGRSIREINGTRVTAAEHEENRHSLRLKMLEEYVTKADCARLTTTQMENAGFIAVNEQDIIGRLVYVQHTQRLLKTTTLSPRDVAVYETAITNSLKEVQKLANTLVVN